MRSRNLASTVGPLRIPPIVELCQSHLGYELWEDHRPFSLSQYHVPTQEGQEEAPRVTGVGFFNDVPRAKASEKEDSKEKEQEVILIDSDDDGVIVVDSGISSVGFNVYKIANITLTESSNKYTV